MGDNTKKLSRPEQPQCPYIKKCGGCTCINEPYSEQLKKKNTMIRKLFEDLARTQGFKAESIVGADSPFFYRNKVHSVFSRDRSGKIIRGMYREESHDLVDVKGCLLEDRTADEVIEEIKRLLPSFKIKVYDEDMRTGFLRHVLVRVGMTEAGRQLMVVLVCSEPVFPSKNNFVKALRSKFPEIKTIVQNLNPGKTSMVLGEKNIVLFGSGYIFDELMGLRFRISPSSFYQINHAQTEKLYGLALEAAGLDGSETVLDAYCGTGTIGMMMAAKAKKVIGVELNKNAVKDAVSNARDNKITNISFVCDDATNYIRRLAAEKASIDLVCMDPPRSGSTPEFISAVAELGCKRVVYVSCGPDTLARDLKLLAKKGYRVKRMTPVDMFPGTGHVETVVRLSKGDIDGHVSSEKKAVKSEASEIISGYRRRRKRLLCRHSAILG